MGGTFYSGHPLACGGNDGLSQPTAGLRAPSIVTARPTLTVKRRSYTTLLDATDDYRRSATTSTECWSTVEGAGWFAQR